jgi:hypothetical protein
MYLSTRIRTLRRQIRYGSHQERGQALVITAIAFLAILAFAGLVTDAGTLYLNFTRLKRGLDAAAVAAANNIKDSSLPAAQRNTFIREAAREMLALNDIEDIYSLETYTCDDAGLPADFASLCPGPGEDKRKLAWVQATQNSPVYFLQLFGLGTVPITTHSVGEAASLDLVLVFDTSESMGSDTPGYSINFDPSACNTANNCQPLRKAKDAAKTMVDKLFHLYDRVAIVTYNSSATIIDPDLSSAVVLEANHNDVKTAIDAIQLNDDPDATYYDSFGTLVSGDMNPMDINGDGTYVGGVPVGFDDAFVTTCTGCGMRVAGNILSSQGRVDSVWVIVILTDGGTNASDLPNSSDANNPVPAGYLNGFCGGSINNRMWDTPFCNDINPNTRHCGPFHANSSECPPGSTWVGNSTPPYDADDYAYDITDRVALIDSTNPNEPTGGEEIAIYSIGLGKAGSPPYTGEELLRYMANIGDDNFRDLAGTNPCAGVPHQTSCGQYYYAPDATYLTEIFEKVAGSIFTRISQ